MPIHIPWIAVLVELLPDVERLSLPLARVLLKERAIRHADALRVVELVAQDGVDAEAESAQLVALHDVEGSVLFALGVGEEEALVLGGLVEDALLAQAGGVAWPDLFCDGRGENVSIV